MLVNMDIWILGWVGIKQILMGMVMFMEGKGTTMEEAMEDMVPLAISKVRMDMEHKDITDIVKQLKIPCFLYSRIRCLRR